MPPIRPATGPDMSRLTGRCARRLDRRHAAGRLHQLHARGVKPASRSASSKRDDVARHLRPDVRVQAHGREALELAVERQHLVRDGQVGLRELLEHDLLDPPLVRRVEVASAAGRPRPPRRRPSFSCAHALAHLVLVERDQHVAVRDGDALLDRQPVAALDERPRLPGQLLLEREVERLLVPGDVEDVAEALAS